MAIIKDRHSTRNTNDMDEDLVKRQEEFISQLTEINELKIDKLQPIETAPKDGTYILLFGDSGYITTPLRCEVCKYYPEYRLLRPWVNHSNDSFEDGGEPATHWMELPKL